MNILEFREFSKYDISDIIDSDMIVNLQDFNLNPLFSY